MKLINSVAFVLLATVSAASAQGHDTQGVQVQGGHGGAGLPSGGHQGVAIQSGGAAYTSDHGALLRQHTTAQHYRSYSDNGFRAQIGATLPGSADLHPLPDGIATSLPTARGHQYSIVNDRYVVVDPASRRVVHTFD